MSDRTIEREMEFSATVERVWKAITEPTELSRWFGDRTRLELTPGAEGAFIWDEHGSFALRVEEVEAPHRLVWSWVHEADVPFADAPATRVEWTLRARDGGGTVLYLKESGFLTDQHFQMNTEGWTEELDELTHLLAA